MLRNPSNFLKQYNTCIYKINIECFLIDILFSALHVPALIKLMCAVRHISTCS